MDEDKTNIQLQIYIPDIKAQKYLTCSPNEPIWDIKERLLDLLQQNFPQPFNYGLFLPPCDGRAGKFLHDDRPIRDYPFHDCAPYLEFKYKKRVYKTLNFDERHIRTNNKSNLKKFMNYVQSKNQAKIEKMCASGLDPNYYGQSGETPLTLACGIDDNRGVILALIDGGAHSDFRNKEGQTAMHKAAFMSLVSNIKYLLELGASPNYKDLIGLTPLYYNVLSSDSNPDVAEMLLRDGAQISVTDMHGNHELHQACKNGLLHHVEHLLYYGADVNAQNVNGNTPLHVCSINNQHACARMLLFRGIDAGILNNQDQTALNVAGYTGGHEVAKLIQNHNPSEAVPYRSRPTYNTNRRLSATLVRQKSTSQSSLYSSNSEYRQPVIFRQQQSTMSPYLNRSNTVDLQMCHGSSEYGTVSRLSTFMPMKSSETNVPRELIIPRGPKGYGFTIRGAKRMDNSKFVPSDFVPALQFFDGLDVNGMAAKSGLHAGDFLLQINGIDVRTAIHDEVVQLIQKSGEMITMKVITVDPFAYLNPYRAITRPEDSISLSSSMHSNYKSGQVAQSALLLSRPLHNQFIDPNEGHYGCGSGFSSPKMMKNFDSLNVYKDMVDSNNRYASLKHGGASRRISAAELENLMIRQSQIESRFKAMSFDQGSMMNLPSVKFNSVADMKRRRQRFIPPPLLPVGLPRTSIVSRTSDYQRALKTFVSSPDLLCKPKCGPEMMVQAERIYGNKMGSEYSRPFQSYTRPRSPPPPPPIKLQNGSPDSLDMKNTDKMLIGPQKNNNEQYMTACGARVIESQAEQETTLQSSRRPAPPPPPPPLPSLNTFRTKKNSNVVDASNSITKSVQPNSIVQGISSESLAAVRLKPTIGHESNAKSISVPKDFDMDLRNALAKRREKALMGKDEIDETSKKVAFTIESTSARGYSGLSLQETVRENVTSSTETAKSQHSPSGITNKKDSGYTSSRTSLEPSEYGEETISSNVMHVSETVHENVGKSSPSVQVRNDDSTLASSNCVTIISNAIEEDYGVKTKQQVQKLPQTIAEHDMMSVSSSISTLSVASSNPAARDALRKVSKTPPIDYEDDENEPDSGTGDSDNDFYSTKMRGNCGEVLNEGSQFRTKKVSDWSVDDVIEWLDSLQLLEHKEKFLKAQINGQKLLSYDRSFFTQLGVTRIAHRQVIEQSLISFTNSG